MEIVKQKIRTDKKLFIATNMQLTESEAKAFWPVYEAYQAELAEIKRREVKLIEDFAANYETKSEDVAKNLLDDSLPIDPSHQRLHQSYLAKFRGVLPDKKDKCLRCQDRKADLGWTNQNLEQEHGKRNYQ
jgi:hypothetical protein